MKNFIQLKNNFVKKSANKISDVEVEKIGDYLMINYVQKNKNFTVQTISDYMKNNNLVNLSEKAKETPETEKKARWVVSKKILIRLGVK